MPLLYGMCSATVCIELHQTLYQCSSALIRGGWSQPAVPLKINYRLNSNLRFSGWLYSASTLEIRPFRPYYWHSLSASAKITPLLT